MADVKTIELNGIDLNVKDAVARQKSDQAVSDVSGLNTRVGAVENSVTSLGTRVGTNEGKIRTLENMSGEFDTDITFLKQSNDRLQSASNTHTGQINQLTRDVDTNEGNIQNLQNAIDGQNARIDTVANGLGSVSSGVASVANDIEELSARMDEFTNLPTGSTSGDAELRDIRVGFNGITYASAGTAVREQNKAILREFATEGCFNALSPYYRDNISDAYATVTRNGDTYHINGSNGSTGNRLYNVVIKTDGLPFGVHAGDYCFLQRDCILDNDTLPADIYYTADGSNWSFLRSTSESAIGVDGVFPFQVPASAIGFLVRFVLKPGMTVNTDITIKLLAFNGKRSFNQKGVLPSGGLNNVYTNGYYLLIDSNSYTELPYGASGVGLLCVLTANTANWQFYIPWAANTIYCRRSINANNWNDWQTISGGSGTGETIYNIYQNTYSVTANPTITTDTNNYLAPTGDASDRTSAIATMLQTTGICRLGAGDYYVSNLVMPNETAIIGSGNKTRIILGSGDFAIKLGSRCLVKDLSIWGNINNITPSITVGNKHGILWQGTYSYDQESPLRSIIESVYITNFSGGGICCDNTGYSSSACIHVTDCYIVNCDCGVYIKYWSEFNKFTNVSAKGCYYGCINNGGNNMFANCDFSSNAMCLLMDNENGQSPNNSHGSYVGCVFNHAGNNEGYGVQILNCDNGTVFDGCQIFYSKTKLINSDGIAFANCNFGASNCGIEINGGGAILYNGNMFQIVPAISISNNSHVVFVNNYVRSTGAVVSA